MPASSEDQHRHVVAPCPPAAKQLLSGGVGQPEVEDHKLGRGGQQPLGLAASGCLEHIEALQGEPGSQKPAHWGLVVNDKHTDSAHQCTFAVVEGGVAKVVGIPVRRPPGS